ncbi:hypothetical protein N440_0503 [Stenotrophomonas sp. CC22-02]|nr:hypothetical protein N440_0503 [Stenotrophomonas sp. CC22-02]
MGVDIPLQGVELLGASGLRGQALRFGPRAGPGIGEVLLMCGLRRISAGCLLCGLGAGNGEVRAAVPQGPSQPGAAGMTADEQQQADAQPQREWRHARAPPAAR